MRLFTVFITLASLSLLPATSFAQSSSADAMSTTQSSAGASSTNAGNAQDITFNQPGQVDYAGRYTVRNVPGIVLGGYSGSFSSDYCGGTSQIGGSIAGFGIGGGHPVMDPVCQGLRIVDRTMGVQRSITQDAAVQYQQAAALSATPGAWNTANELRLQAARKSLLADQLTCAAVALLSTESDAAQAAYKAAGVVCILR